MDRHVDFIGYLHIAQSALVVLGALAVFLLMAGGGMLSGEPNAIFITTTIGIIISFLLFIWAVPGFIAGYGLLKRRSWGWALGLVMGFFDLFNVPLGTLLGAYTFWALLRNKAQAEFNRTPRSTNQP